MLPLKRRRKSEVRFGSLAGRTCERSSDKTVRAQNCSGTRLSLKRRWPFAKCRPDKKRAFAEAAFANPLVHERLACFDSRSGADWRKCFAAQLLFRPRPGRRGAAAD